MSKQLKFSGWLRLYLDWHPVGGGTKGNWSKVKIGKLVWPGSRQLKKVWSQSKKPTAAPRNKHRTPFLLYLASLSAYHVTPQTYSSPTTAFSEVHWPSRCSSSKSSLLWPQGLCTLLFPMPASQTLTQFKLSHHSVLCLNATSQSNAP